MKKVISAKAREAWKRNLDKWETRQAHEMLIAGFVIGAVGVLLISLIIMAL